MVDPDGTAATRALAGPNGKMAWQLHPPTLRALGMDRKITVGSWATPGVSALAKAKWVRGTMLDPFRWAEVRRVERELTSHYVEAIDVVLAGLSTDNFQAAVSLVQLPELVCGYEHIKLANIENYRETLSTALQVFRQSESPTQ
jgi:indolepyruvate ferredoxin oxidoreductase